MGGKRKSLSTWPAVETLFDYYRIGPSARSAECSMVEMDVSTRIVISKAMNEEEWDWYM